MKKKEKISRNRWLLIIFFGTFLLSAIFNMLSTNLVENIDSIVISVIILIIVMAIGIVFDIIGTAVTAAEEVPFHSMASAKKKGAKESLNLIKNSDRVANVCNDVIGDICGVLSGAMGALISASISGKTSSLSFAIITLLVTATITAFTVLIKGLFKEVAINNCNKIIEVIGRIISVFHKAK